MNAKRTIRRAFPALVGKRSRHRLGSRRASRGQALVEFALIIFPLLLLLIVGATDVSTLLNDHLDVVYAARAGARVGSVIGNYAPAGAPYTADCAVIGAVQSALSSSRGVNVSQIAIYDASSVPDGSYSAALAQDVYPGNTVCNANGTTTPGATSATWAPTGDNTGKTGRNNTPFAEDSIGVAITYTYTYSFNLFNLTSPVVTDWAVMPIEIVVNPVLPTPTPTPAP
ncbi:MAG TPA: TadE/TadG family type IV pilus assembly protein [Ktedonobacterales bacterium]|nr:TadE/TadG family type IV pilus assembly protein [Ktedonobacterales bacterium]